MSDTNEQTFQEASASAEVYRLPQEVVTLDEIEMDTKLEVKGDNGSDENNVESPTTGENYVFRCVFCERVLSAAEAPKLLECLHNTCGSCINNKLFEQNEGNEKGEFVQHFQFVHFLSQQLRWKLSAIFTYLRSW